MSNSADLDFKIRTVAELAGAEQAARALEMQIGKAKALGQDYSKLQAQLDTVNASLKNLTPELQKLHETETTAGKGAEGLLKSHEQLNKLMTTLPPGIGGVGRSLVEMLRGPVGPAIALGTVIQRLGAEFSEWQKNLDEVGAAAAHGQFSDAIRAVAADMETARQKTEAYALTVASIAQHEVTIAQALQSQLALMSAVATARAAATKAESDLAKAKIDSKEKAGRLTPEEAVLAQTAVAVKAAQDEAAAKKKAENDKVVAKQSALDQATLDQRKLDADRAETARIALEAQKRRDRLAPNFGPDGKVDFTTVAPVGGWGIPGTEKIKVEKGMPIQDAIRKAQEEVADWEEKLEAAQKKAAAKGQRPEEKAYNESELQKTKDYLAQAEGQLRNFQRGQNQYRAAHSDAANADFQGKEFNAAEAEKKARANADNADKLRRELDDARKTATAVTPDIDKELAARVALIMQQAVDKLSEMPHGAEIATGIKLAQVIEDKLRAVGIADQARAGKTPTAEDAAFLMKFVASQGGNPKDFNAAVGFVASNKSLQNERGFDTQDQTGQQLDASNAYLLKIANALGAHATNLKDAAEFVSKLKDNSDANLKAVAELVRTSYSNQQKEIDRLKSYIQNP